MCLRRSSCGVKVLRRQIFSLAASSRTKITFDIVKPVTVLLEFVTLINKKHTVFDIPPMQGGSREVNQVYASLSKLHKIVRFSNMAFFSGKMKSAYRLLVDALSLFRRADDEKAVGIASNNLGNTYVTLFMERIIRCSYHTHLHFFALVQHACDSKPKALYGQLL